MISKELYNGIKRFEFKILRYSEFREILENNRSNWKTNKKLSASKVLNELIENGTVEYLELIFSRRKEVLYLF